MIEWKIFHKLRIAVDLVSCDFSNEFSCAVYVCGIPDWKIFFKWCSGPSYILDLHKSLWLSLTLENPLYQIPLPSKFPVFPPEIFLRIHVIDPMHPIASHSFPHPLLVLVCLDGDHQLCCWCFPHQATAPFVLLCPDPISVRPLSLPWASTTHKKVN